MGVIRCNFGPRRQPVPVLALHTQGFDVSVLFFGYDEERAERDAIWIAQEPDKVEATSRQVELMKPLLFPCISSLDMAAIESRREKHMSITLSELCDWINASQRYQWPLIPNHYRALALECIGRLHQAATLTANRKA